MSVLTNLTIGRSKFCVLSSSLISVSKRYLKVAVLGAGGKTGKPLSLMLKQCSYVDELALYDKEPTDGLVAELEQLDTVSVVTSKRGPTALHNTLKGSDIIVLLAGSGDETEAFEKNAPVIAELSENCAKVSPNALLTVVTTPINSIVPLVVEIYRRVNKVVDYNRIFGFATADIVRASCFAAEILAIPPEKISVPVVGGTGPETSVPVLNTLPLGTEEAVRITTATREAAQKQHPLSTAYAISRFVHSLARALTGARDIIECAYVHSYSFCNSPSPYLTTPLQIGTLGMEKNLGLPPLSQYERCLLETALPTLHKDIEKGIKYGKQFKLKN